MHAHLMHSLAQAHSNDLRRHASSRPGRSASRRTPRMFARVRSLERQSLRFALPRI
jgi:hypothetical protein